MVSSYPASSESRSPSHSGGEGGVDQLVNARRNQLMREAESEWNEARSAPYRRPEERDFRRSERGETTIWFGGLTLRHEALSYAALEGLGYKVGIVPTPNRNDFQAGKEYGNNGQCNPTYFTVGALVNHLKNLRDQHGLSLEEINDRHVFVTAGACGPCRFGMYEAEYRLALRNSGFDGFRVLLFQQKGGLKQTASNVGIDFDVPFFLAFLNALFLGDLFNEVGYQIRPYEVEPGSTDRALEKCISICQETLRTRDFGQTRRKLLPSILTRVLSMGEKDEIAMILEQLESRAFPEVLDRCRKVIEEEVEVDYTRPKPIVKVTGEFWAQTTEGDGNYRMFPFLEREGAEVLVEPVATWVSYMLHQAKDRMRARRGLGGSENESKAWSKKLGGLLEYGSRKFTYAVADRLIAREYDRLRGALGGTTHPLANQYELTRMGHPYYDSRSQGGEGHLEVAKNIYYTTKSLAHMVLSLKPFGCMPSTQSDGAQAAVVSQFKDMIYLPIETSGEGEINAHSRVQMALGDAKVKCKEEFKRSVAQTGYSLEQIRRFVGERREFRQPLRPVSSRKGIVGKAARFVLEMGEEMRRVGVPV